MDAFKDPNVAAVLVEVKFGQDGKVESCRVLRSTIPFSLEASTVDYIQKNWGGSFFAGETEILPITFELPPSLSLHAHEDMPTPPDPLAIGDAERNMKMRLTFDEDGWVKKIDVTEPSGLDSLDRDTAIWVKVHWHHDAFAGQAVDVPFKFMAPEPPPPPPPPKVVKPKSPPPPPEPVAIPAIRAE